MSADTLTALGLSSFTVPRRTGFAKNRQRHREAGSIFDNWGEGERRVRDVEVVKNRYSSAPRLPVILKLRWTPRLRQSVNPLFAVR